MNDSNKYTIDKAIALLYMRQSDVLDNKPSIFHHNFIDEFSWDFPQFPIYELTQDIASHYKLEGYNFNYSIHHEMKCAGHVEIYPNKECFIDMTLKREYNAYTIVSILANVISQIDLAEKGIAFENPQEFEILADVWAVINGFGDIMEKGYAPLEASEIQVGYITSNEVKYIKELISHLIR